jgi:hypothetical protein
LLPGQQDNGFEALGKTFQAAYYTIACIQALSVVIFLLTQTMCTFAYDWTVRNGVQASEEEIGASLVQNNRAYGASDTILYIPILASSAYGLFSKKSWSLICTAASAGISSYWTLTVAFLMMFSSRYVEEYDYVPGAGLWILVLFYMVYGILVLAFLYRYWDILNHVMG